MGLNSIIARMGLDTAGFRKDLLAVGKETTRVTSKMASDQERAARRAAEAHRKAAEQQRAALRASVGELAGLVGLPLGLAGLATGAKKILDYAGSIQDASDAMGIGVEALQELRAAFALSGANAETLDKGLIKLTENMVKARDGDTKLIASFGALGVTWRDLHALSPDAVLMRIAASADAAGDPSERLSLLLDVLGKSGSKMAAGLNGGADALAALRANAGKLTKEEISLLDEAGDALTRLGNAALLLGSRPVIGWKKLIDSVTGHEDPTLPDFPAGYKPPQEPAVPATQREPDASEPFVPAPPDVRAQIEDEAKAAMDQLRMETANAQKLADMEDEQRVKKQEEDEKAAQELAELEKKEIDECREHEKKAAEEVADEKRKLAEEAAEAAKRAADKAADEEKERLEDRREEFIEDKLDPGGKAQRRREKRKRETLGARFDREEALRERGGISQKDWDAGVRPKVSGDYTPTDFDQALKPQLGEKVKPRLVEQLKPRLADLVKGSQAAASQKPDAGTALKDAIDESKVVTELQNLNAKFGVNIK